MENVLIVIIGSLLAILSAIHLFILNDVKKEIRFNRDDFYQKMERIIRLWEKKNDETDDSLKNICKILEMHEVKLTNHETLLHLDHQTRQTVMKEKG